MSNQKLEPNAIRIFHIYSFLFVEFQCDSGEKGGCANTATGKNKSPDERMFDLYLYPQPIWSQTFDQPCIANRQHKKSKHAICTCCCEQNPPVFRSVAFWHGNNIGKQYAIGPKHTKTISGRDNFQETLFFEVYCLDAMSLLRNLIAPQSSQSSQVQRWQLSQSPRPRRGKPSIMVRN